MWNKPTQGFLACEAEYDAANIVLFGAPFDGTTSYRPGTRFGSSAIRGESYGIETYSPYQDRDLSDLAVFDYGDLDLPFGNPKAVLNEIYSHVSQILKDKKKPVMLGGEHLITYGAVRALIEKYPDLHILHFDAHADLREDYLGQSLSHACVLRRTWELVGDDRIFQFGIRSGTREEFNFAKEHLYMEKFTANTFADVVKSLSGKPIYLTLDLDVLDPSIFCGTGTPEAGGLSFHTLLDCLLTLKDIQLVGCDINELAPNYDQSGASTAVACKLTREILLLLGG